MVYETQRICPASAEHGQQVAMSKVQQGNVTIDVCAYGCTFLDRGELEQLLQASFVGHGHRPPAHFMAPPPAHGHHAPRIRDPRQYMHGVFSPRQRRHGGHGSSSSDNIWGHSS
jgi:Zn-finger nucleic acid-binding protein